MTAFREFQGRLRYLGNRLIRHLFSLYRWVVMIKAIEPETVPDHTGGRKDETLSLRQAHSGDLTALLIAYPREFSAHLSDTLKHRLLMSRMEDDIPCFIAVNTEGDVCAGAWCLPRHDPLVAMSLGKDAGRGVFEMMNTFVVPAYRGQGLAQALRRYALSRMAANGFHWVVSYVWYSRQQSLAMNFATGSAILGEKTQVSLLGWRGVFYRHRLNLGRLPLPQKPPVLVVGSPGTLRRHLRRCFRHWGIHTRILNLSKGRSRKRLSQALCRMQKKTGSVPLVFCLDSDQRKMAETLIAESSLQATLPEWPQEPLSPEDFLAREKQGCGVVGLWYLSALGHSERLMLWRRNETLAVQKGHNVS